MKKVIIAVALFSLSFSAFADNFTIQLPDYVCSGTPTGWTTTQTSTGVSVRCASTGTTPPVGAPTGCVARLNGGTSNITLSSGGGSAAFSVSCSTPPSGITHNWSKNGVFGESTAQSWTASFGANASTSVDNIYYYQVRECNGSSCVTVNTTPLSVTVSKATGGWNGTCSGFTATHVITLPWGGPDRKFTANYGGFGVNDAIVVKFTTGSISTSTSLPRITAAEYNSSPSSRIAVIAATPCDFSTQSTPGAYNIGNSITATFAIGTGTGYGYYPVLRTNTEYYLNMKNSPGSTCSLSGQCDMFIELIGASNL